MGFSVHIFVIKVTFKKFLPNYNKTWYSCPLGLPSMCPLCVGHIVSNFAKKKRSSNSILKHDIHAVWQRHLVSLLVMRWSHSFQSWPKKFQPDSKTWYSCCCVTAALGQFACYARIFSLWCLHLDPAADSLLNTAQYKVSLEPISVEPVCLSALYSVAYTLSSPFINNLFDWWPLCMTTMSTSPPSIIITIAIIPFSWHLNQMSLAYLEI